MASPTQRLSLDPALWARTRREAFDRGLSASALVADALAEWFARLDEPPAGVASDDPPVAEVLSVSEDATGITVEAELLPWDPKPRLVSTPQEAAEAVAQLPAGRAFSPAPKPASARRRPR